MKTSRGVAVAGVQAAALAALLAASPGPARAIQFHLGPVIGSLDNTVSAGTSFRVAERSEELVGRSQGGKAYSVNGDDGNLNYGWGGVGDPFAATYKATHDLQLTWRDFGAFVRGSYFYDVESIDQPRARLPLTEAAKNLVGRDGRLLDAYVRAGLSPGGLPLDLRAGWQVVNWGESSFLTNGINVANPVDVSKLRLPGSELREALLGVPMVRASAGLGAGLAVEGFYSIVWDRTDIDPPGSYFSTNDFAGAGGEYVVLGFGGVPDGGLPGLPLAVTRPWTHVGRAPDREATDPGQFGVALRWFAPMLDTEFGLYHLNVHSKLPIISARAASSFAPNPLRPGNPVMPVPGSGRYFIEYPEDIQVFGASFNTDLLGTGVALQGEYSLHRDEPLQVDDVELLFAALAPAPVPTALYVSQLPQPAPGAVVPGYIRRDVSQAQVTASKVFGPRLRASQWVVLGEVGLTQVHDMPDQAKLRLEGPGTALPGNALAAAANGVPAQDGGFATEFSWGYRLIARVDFESVIGAVGFSPRLAFSHDVNGVAPVPAGNFVDGRKALTAGLGASYLVRWSGDVSYTSFFGAGAFNQLSDRDFVSVAVKYAF